MVLTLGLLTGILRSCFQGLDVIEIFWPSGCAFRSDEILPRRHGELLSLESHHCAAIPGVGKCQPGSRRLHVDPHAIMKNRDFVRQYGFGIRQVSGSEACGAPCLQESIGVGLRRLDQEFEIECRARHSVQYGSNAADHDIMHVIRLEALEYVP